MYFPPYLAKHLQSYAERIKNYIGGDFSQSGPDERKKICAEVRELAARAGALIAPMPIPFADIWTITPVQIAMVQAIGNIYGYKISGKNLKAVFATVAGGWVGQQICLALFKIGLPGAGGFGGAAFVYVWTHAIGRTAEAYFSSGMSIGPKKLGEIRKQSFEDQRAQERNSPKVLDGGQ